MITIAMALSVFAGVVVNAETTNVVMWDFNDGKTLNYGGHNQTMQYSDTDGVSRSRCLKMDVGWGVYPFSGAKLFTAEKGNIYKVSLMFKGALYKGVFPPISDVQSDTEFTNAIVRNGAPNASDWTEASFEYKCTKSEDVYIDHFQNGTGTTYIDNIKVDIVGTFDPGAEPTAGPYNPSGKKAKILCVGDSITHGNGSSGSYFTSYRYPMWKMMIGDGRDFEFVGPYNTNFIANCTFDTYAGQTFNNKHYAIYGVKIEPMTESIETGILDGIDYNVAIINLGTNNRTDDYNVNNNDIPNALSDLVDALRSKSPSVTVLLCGMCDSWTPGLNDAIEAKAKDISKAWSPVYYVPAPKGWVADPNSASTFTLDWVHPNEKGCNAMATTYYDALVKDFFDAADLPTPPTTTSSPTPGGTPSQTPGVTPTPTGSGSAPTNTSASATPSATPSGSGATATVTPTPMGSGCAPTNTSASPSETPAGDDTVTIKFAKKSVKIKMGKKATLKVKIVGAKKAKFSLKGKKSKKVLKIVKKKAKKVVVKAKKKGKAVVLAKAGNKKATCKVKVS